MEISLEKEKQWNTDPIKRWPHLFMGWVYLSPSQFYFHSHVLHILQTVDWLCHCLKFFVTQSQSIRCLNSLRQLKIFLQAIAYHLLSTSLHLKSSWNPEEVLILQVWQPLHTLSLGNSLPTALHVLLLFCLTLDPSPFVPSFSRLDWKVVSTPLSSPASSVLP